MTQQRSPEDLTTEKLPERLPILPLHETALYPKMVLPLVVMQGDSIKLVDEAMQKDRNTLIQALRTHNMYPPGTYTERIADAIVELFQPGANSSAELFFEEREMFESIDEDLLMDAEADEEDDAG